MPFPPVQLSEGILVIRENKHSNTTKMFAGKRKSRIPFTEFRVHNIPAEMQPIEMRIKYKALSAEIIGYDDQRAVNKNQKPGIIRRMVVGRRLLDVGCWILDFRIILFTLNFELWT